MDDKKIAVLIDAENVSGKYIKLILDEVSNYGSATYKRLYGDFQTPSVRAWMKNLRDYAITPVFQYNYTQGKNASDSALIIDAMDILYSGNVDGFCIVTSDSDFTKLVLRLRESGMTVIGMGERKTPNAFVSACETFKFLDILLNDENPSQNPSLPQTRKESEADGSRKEAEKESDPNAVSNIPNMEEMEKEIISIINTHADDDGWVDLSELGDNLPKRVPGFDPRNYKCTKLNSLSSCLIALRFGQRAIRTIRFCRSSMCVSNRKKKSRYFPRYGAAENGRRMRTRKKSKHMRFV